MGELRDLDAARDRRRARELADQGYVPHPSVPVGSMEFTFFSTTLPGVTVVSAGGATAEATSACYRPTDG